MTTQPGHNPTIKLLSHLIHRLPRLSENDLKKLSEKSVFLDIHLIHPSLCSSMNALHFCLVCSTRNQTPNLSSIIYSSTCTVTKREV